MTASNEQVTLRKGDYIATADLSEDDYHKVAQAFMAAGCEFPDNLNKDANIIGWSALFNCYGWDYEEFASFNRQLTLTQILNATNAGSHANQPKAETAPMHLTDRLEAAILAQSEANAEVERLQAEWRAAYPGISGCVDIDVEDIKPEDWQAGDIVECIKKSEGDTTEYKMYTIIDPLDSWGDITICDDAGDNCDYPADDFRFIRRP